MHEPGAAVADGRVGEGTAASVGGAVSGIPAELDTAVVAVAIGAGDDVEDRVAEGTGVLTMERMAIPATKISSTVAMVARLRRVMTS